MPSLTLDPSRDQSPSKSARPPQLAPLAPPAHGNDTITQYAVGPAPGSPVAPDYSPITPRAQPALPLAYSPPSQSVPQTVFGGDNDAQPVSFPGSVTGDHHPPDYIPEPPPQPFSSEDATDAIALRAAISSLQFQKKKAQDDIRTLEKIRKKALDEPELFKSELSAGRLKEEKPKIGDLQAILDHEGSDDDDDDDDVEVVLGAERGSSDDTEMKSTNGQESQDRSNDDDATPFNRIPGPQNVVRMPYINWDKYHITGEPLDSMHEQQRKWPGDLAYGQDRGREHAVAAPYSPWLDSIDGQGQQRWERNDSVSIGTPTAAVTPTGTVSEHPMETRRKTNQ